MKKLLFFSFLLLISEVYSQKLGIDIQESKVFKMTTARVQNDYLLADGSGGFISISTKRSGFLANPLIFESYATRYNNKMEQVRTKTFKLNKGSIKGSIKGAFVRDGFLQMINMETNSRKRYFSFKHIEGNIATGIVQQNEFFRINQIYSKNDVNLYVNFNSLYYQKLKYYSDVNYFNPKIFIKFSKNNHYFTIIHRDFVEDVSRYFIDVFNDRFEQVYHKSIVETVPTIKYYINDISVNDSNGDVYMIAKTYNSDPLVRIRFASKSNLDHFTIYKINKREIKRSLVRPKKIVEDLNLVLGDKQLSVLGFYRDKYINLNDIDGLMRMNIDTADLSIVQTAYGNFNKKLVSVKFKTKRQRSKNHKMIIRKAFLLTNNDIIINAEDFFIPKLSKINKREESIREIVGDVFSIRIGRGGQIQWSKDIYKSQAVKPRLALHSVFSTMVNGSNYILFTDSKTKKQSKKQSFYLKDKDLQNLIGVRIAGQGAMQEAIIKENKRSKYRFMPIEGTMINKNEAIIPAKDHQFIKFFKLTFN